MSAVLPLVIIAVPVLMIVDNPLSRRRLGVEWLTVLVEGHLGSGPTNLWPVLGPTRLFGAVTSVHIRVSEAWQAQTEISATA
jgi:hypothetical protein